MDKNRPNRRSAKLGAIDLGDGRCQFRVWAPKHENLELHIVEPDSRLLPMRRCERGYFELEVDRLPPGARYFYRLEKSRDRPDPASRFQPHGVHRPSEVVPRDFSWEDTHWHGLPLHRYITYELHVGTFTQEGTFDAIIPHLRRLCDLGITAIELLPVAQFPGDRNWGYDGVHMFAPQDTYGGPAGLKRLVNACHLHGLAVVMDVVYNHLGPEGNYLDEFGYYFTERYRTPWGSAVNFDRHHSDEVRRFFIENARFWIDEHHIDALRLDSVHAIFDFSARPFLRELSHAVREEGERHNRLAYTIAESNLNDPRLMRSSDAEGLGIDAQWCDDFHHALHTTLTGESAGYYQDFCGFDDLIKAYQSGFVQEGRYSPYRGRRHGVSAESLEPAKLVVYAQNHDQVGNRMRSDRLSQIVSFEQLKLAAAAVLLSPYQPLLWMGEEYGETAPFWFFTSFLDQALGEAVRVGRQREFASFAWSSPIADPQDEQTFIASKLNHALAEQGHHQVLWSFHRTLIELRKTEPLFEFAYRDRMESRAIVPNSVMLHRRWDETAELNLLFNFSNAEQHLAPPLRLGKWHKILDSADKQWLGPGSQVAASFDASANTRLTLLPFSAILIHSDS